MRWAILAACTAPCCVSVLSLDEFDDAVAALCKCDDVVPQYMGTCTEVLSRRLDNVSEQTRQAWLEAYARDCHGECLNGFACYQQPGTCAVVSCTENRECCGYVDGGTTVCVKEECATCSAIGQACDEAADCCDGSASCVEDVCTLP